MSDSFEHKTRDSQIRVLGSDRSLGIKEMFTERALKRSLFSKHEIKDLSNIGFFASKKGVLGYTR